MPSTLEKQVEELKKAGYPVKQGIRQFAPNTNDHKRIAGGLWVHRWAKHAAQNLPIISRSTGVRFLADSAIGVPVFIVGIGPSLDETIEKLADVKGRALIFSTDAAYRVLQAHNIEPDLVMTFDCQKQQSTLWEHAITKHTALVCNSCAHPDTIQNWNGPILFYNHWHRGDDFIERLLPYIYPHLGQLPSTGTVGNMLVVLAKHMGCGPIFTVGMDFCYQMRGGIWQYRCKDYRRLKVFDQPDMERWPWQPGENKLLYDNDARLLRAHDEDIFDTLSNNNIVYKTDPELKIYRESFLGVCDGLGIKPMDCSPGGLLKSYFRQLHVERALHEFCQKDLPPGRTVIPFLGKLINDGKKEWQRDRLAGLIS